MNNDNRKHPRIKITPPLQVIDTLTDRQLGMLVNLSQEGMMLLGDNQVVNDGVYQVRVPLKQSREGEVSLSLGVECLWSRPADVDEKTWSGFRIIDISEQGQTLLGQTIDTLHS